MEMEEKNQVHVEKKKKKKQGNSDNKCYKTT